MNFKCKHCGQDYEVDDVAAGQVAECAECGKDFVIEPEDVRSLPDFFSPSVSLLIPQPQNPTLTNHSKASPEKMLCSCNCGARHSRDAVICVNCGLNLKTGTRQRTKTGENFMSNLKNFLWEKPHIFLMDYHSKLYRLLVFSFLFLVAYWAYTVICPRSGLVTMHNYKKIELGMTEDAVRKILGRPYASSNHLFRDARPMLDVIFTDIMGNRNALQKNSLTDNIASQTMNISYSRHLRQTAKVAVLNDTNVLTISNYPSEPLVDLEGQVKASVTKMMRDGNWGGKGVNLVALANSSCAEDFITYTIFKYRDGRSVERINNTFRTNINLYRLHSTELFNMVEKSLLLEEQEGRKKNRGGITSLSSLYERYGGVNIARLYTPVVIKDDCVGIVGILAVNEKNEKVNMALYGALQVISHESYVNGGKSVLYQEGGFCFDLFETGEIIVRGRLLVWKGNDGSAIYAVANPNITYRAYVCSSQN